jgi:hypothetical protein
VLKQLYPRQSERLIGGKVDDGALQLARPPPQRPIAVAI